MPNSNPKPKPKRIQDPESQSHVGSGSGRGQNPAQPAKLRREVRDEDDEIRTLGSKAGKPKVYGDRAYMIGSYLSPKEVIALMDALEEQKAVGDSLNELQLEEEEEEEGFELCRICSKEDDHWTEECPWLDLVPKDATVGSGYGVVCTNCGEVGGHPGRDWTGRAVITLCGICQNIGHHWTEDCPKRDPAEFQRPHLKVLMDDEEFSD